MRWVGTWTAAPAPSSWSTCAPTGPRRTPSTCRSSRNASPTCCRSNSAIRRNSPVPEPLKAGPSPGVRNAEDAVYPLSASTIASSAFSRASFSCGVPTVGRRQSVSSGWAPSRFLISTPRSPSSLGSFADIFSAASREMLKEAFRFKSMIRWKSSDRKRFSVSSVSTNRSPEIRKRAWTPSSKTTGTTSPNRQSVLPRMANNRGLC